MAAMFCLEIAHRLKVHSDTCVNEIVSVLSIIKGLHFEILSCKNSICVKMLSSLQHFKKFHEALTFLNRAADLQNNVRLCVHVCWILIMLVTIETRMSIADYGRNCFVQDTTT